ncbi:MAG: 3-deoxy-7-phosphoheptulonate synthase [Candidatus Baltobacteraceae bacterium]
MEIAVYQGVEGAYSQLVLEYFLSQRNSAAQTRGVDAYRELATRVAGERAAFGVVPVENAIGGTVREGYDLLAEFGLAPVAEIDWRTDHRLLGVNGSRIENVREILAHPLVIAECGRFLSSLPAARAIPCEDTGVAAREVARRGAPSVGALAPSAAADRYDLIELAAHCSDDPRTYSRFIVFAARPQAHAEPGSANGRKTSMIVAVEDAAGMLARVLAHFGDAGINITKLDSKPRLGFAREHVFYIDVCGDVRDRALSGALESVRRDARSVTLLGSYDAHCGAPIGGEGMHNVRVAVSASAPRVNAAPPRAVATFPRVARSSRPDGTRLHVGGVTIGDGEFTIIAGPCAVESREQMLEVAAGVASRGAIMLRGGAFKPRTSPYAFAGLGWDGIALLSEAGRLSGLPTVSEVMTIDQVERMSETIDVLQIGARNMQNFDLLKAVGQSGHPVLLKRGLSATIDEFLAAAEYILAEGNPSVVLCERGIRTFEPATRNTLDLSAIPVLRERTHLPVLIDPSHAVGVRRWIRPMCRAAKAAGAHGLLLEVHPNPAEAKCDSDQALTLDDFAEVIRDLDGISIWSNHEALV